MSEAAGAPAAKAASAGAPLGSFRSIAVVPAFRRLGRPTNTISVVPAFMRAATPLGPIAKILLKLINQCVVRSFSKRKTKREVVLVPV